MQTTTRTNTEAMVDCVNRVHGAANKLERELRETFAPLVGKKIVKNNWSLMKKYKDLVPKIDGLQIWQYKTSSEICFEIKGCELGRNANYHAVWVTVGVLDGNGVLASIDPRVSNYRTDWTVEEVKQARINISDAKDALNEAERSLGPFTLHPQG